MKTEHCMTTVYHSVAVVRMTAFATDVATHVRAVLATTGP
jgi:hypothetical protein